MDGQEKHDRTRRNIKLDQQRKLISAVLAGFQIGSSNTNPTWRALCESLSNDMTDRPYLRAIFAYIASGDWYRVLNEPRLSLKERLAVALRVLDDDKVKCRYCYVSFFYRNSYCYRCSYQLFYPRLLRGLHGQATWKASY